PRLRPWSGAACQSSCCARCSTCRPPSWRRRSSAFRRPSFSAPPSLRGSTRSGIPSRRRSRIAHSFSIAGAPPTPPSREPCSRSTNPRWLRTPRSSPITSMRPASCSKRHAGTSKLAEASDAVFEFEMRSVLAHAQLAVGRLAPARATAERALTEVAQVAGLREAVGRSTAPGLCRVWWALASAHLGRTTEAEAALEALLAEESERALQALYGTHAFLCEVLRLRGDLPGALAHGRRAVELAEEHGSVFSRVEAAAFLGAAEL